jgi:radical SAM superfamily enzyme YgiQ (UPF0313 family)
MTQLNTPYPATAYLTGFLRERGYRTTQSDPALELILKLLSRSGVERVYSELIQKREKGSKNKEHSAMESDAVLFFVREYSRIREVIEPTVRFLQGKDPTLAVRIVRRDYLPEGSRVARAFANYVAVGDPDAQWAFGSLGVQDRAKYLASLFLDEIADAVREGIDSRFGFSRYAEKLAASQPTFDPILSALNAEPTLIDQMLDEVIDATWTEWKRAVMCELKEQKELESLRLVLGITVPFPGNVYAGFRIARRLKARAQAENLNLTVILGGGYVNTELRELKDARVFDAIDYIVLDDGERPFLSLLEGLAAPQEPKRFLRTFYRETPANSQSKVVFASEPALHDIPHAQAGTPTYDGLKLDQYLSIFELLNPMHRIWSDGRWNKLTLAHGCYWKKCSFCDVSLDYIGRYDPQPSQRIADQIEALIAETGNRGFHFVDEAAPPKALKELSQILIERGVSATWWGNVRFDRAFDAKTARLMAQAGCVAVSGGLEAASDRLLKLMQKGVSVEQVAQVTRNLTDAGILVHAYLMYGFASQTVQETVDALERVRQLFAEGCIQSAYWHRFSVTAHSPVGKNPKAFGIHLKPEEPVLFARNDLGFEDPLEVDHDSLGVGLNRALYNYMHGAGLDQDVREWFDFKVPKAQVPKTLIRRALEQT